MRNKIEMKLTSELQTFVNCIADEMKDAIVAAEMQSIVDDYERNTNLGLPEDIRYYKKLTLAAERIRRHYSLPE